MATAAALIEARSDAVLHLDEGDLRRIAPGRRVMIQTHPGTVIGLHPYGEVTVRHLSGVTWPLDEANISTGTRGVHNVATSTEVWIEVGQGDLIVSRSRAPHLA
jgi:thiamine pyrophosphokinase